jgi:hypothetical protein
MGCVPSKKCVEPNVIKQVVEKPNVIKQVVEKPTTVASILEAVPFLLKNIPTDVLRTNLLPYLSNSYEPDALPDQNVPNIICKYYSDGEDMIYTRVRYGSIENWNTSKVTDMSYLFAKVVGVYDFDLDLSNWNISRVKSIKNMFGDYHQDNLILKATHQDHGLCFINSDSTLNQILRLKNVSSNKGVCMISVVKTYRFNHPIGKWETSNVLDMRGMFYNAESFNRPISNWGTSRMINWNDNRIYNEPIGNWDIL